MGLHEQAAFCTDRLDLKVNEKVPPYEWVKQFDLAQSAKKVDPEVAHLPILSRLVSINGIDGNLYMYGDTPNNEPKLNIKKPRSLHKYFRRKRWTNEGIPDLPIGICLAFTLTSAEQIAQLEKYDLEVEHAKRKYILDCSAGLEVKDIANELRKRPKVPVHSFSLIEIKDNFWDESDDEEIEEVYNPFPSRPAPLSFLTVTLRQEKDDGKGETITHPLDQRPPTYYSLKELALV